MHKQLKRVFQEALNDPKIKKQRLQMDITVTAGTSSSTSRVHLPPPPPQQGYMVSMRMQMVEADLKQDEGDGTNLMQRPLASTTRTSATARLTTRLRALLSAVHPEVRPRIIRKIRALLLSRLRVLLLRARMILDLLLLGIIGMQIRRPRKARAPR